MKLQRQPTRTTCGQTCVSMVSGVPVESVINTIGSRKTRGIELIRAFRHYGVKTDLKMTRWPTNGFSLSENRSILALKTTKRDGKKWQHWVVIVCLEETVRVYDPCINGVHTFERYYKKGYMKNSEFTSYFAVY